MSAKLPRDAGFRPDNRAELHFANSTKIVSPSKSVFLWTLPPSAHIDDWSFWRIAKTDARSKNRFRKVILALTRPVLIVIAMTVAFLPGCAPHSAAPSATAEKPPTARESLERLIAVRQLRSVNDVNASPQYAYDLALGEVARHAGQPAEALGAAIDAWTKAVASAPNPAPYDLALAYFKAGQFAQAAEQASKAYEQAKTTESAPHARAIQAALLHGHAAYASGQFEPALQAYRNATTLIEPGRDSRELGLAEDGIGQSLHELGRYSEAESLWRLALMKRKEVNGSSNPEAANALTNLAVLLDELGRSAEAEPLLRRALAIDTTQFGDDHPYVAQDLDRLAQLLEDTERAAEAEPLRRRALAIAEAAADKSPATVAARLINLALVLKYTHRAEEAEALIRRALGIDEASFGTNSPEVAADLNNLAQLLKDNGRLAEAESLMRRALAVAEANHGADHLDVAIDLNNLAQVLEATNRPGEAEPLARRATAIFAANLGWEHDITGKVHAHWVALMRALGKGKREIDRRQLEMGVPVESRDRANPPDR